MLRVASISLQTLVVEKFGDMLMGIICSHSVASLIAYRYRLITNPFLSCGEIWGYFIRDHMFLFRGIPYSIQVSFSLYGEIKRYIYNIIVQW